MVGRLAFPSQVALNAVVGAWPPSNDHRSFARSN